MNMNKTAKQVTKYFLLSEEDVDKEKKVKKHIKKGWIPARYQITWCVFAGLFVMYCLRVNMIETMVVMVKPDKLAHHELAQDSCPTSEEINPERKINKYEGEFEWNEVTQGLIQGGLYYGYIFSHLIGGLLITRVGPKRLMGYGILFSSFLTMLTPMAARIGSVTMIAARVLVGLGLGVAIPAVYTLTSSWIPVQEKALQLCIMFTGMQIGTIVMLPLSSWICDMNILISSWEIVFYISGLTGFIWWIFWNWFVYDTPQTSPYVSEEELKMILKNTEESGAEYAKPSAPWRKILTSRAVWASALTSFSSSWIFYTMLIELPNYMKHVLHASTIQNGLGNSFIFLIQTFVALICSYLSDIITSKKTFSRTTVRKWFEILGLMSCAIFLLTIPSLGCNHTNVYIVLLMAQSCQGLIAGGEAPLPVDLAPDYSGPVSAFTNGFGNLAGVAAPLFVGWVTNHNESMAQWNIVFYASAFFSVLGSFIFLTLGSAETQPWGVLKSELPSSFKVKQEFTDSDDEDEEYLNN